ncbi:TetR family transcriptional regulator [Rhodococcus hoagii]|nr:TetR family transcriptional regulator [Prescottella equi]
MTVVHSGGALFLSDVQRRLLVAAERLFAERGVDNVSLREIGAGAQQRNHSAVQYHFKTKAALIQALYDFRLVPLNRRRLEMLAARDEHTFEELVEAYIRPLGDAVVETGGGSSYARFVHRYLGEGAGDFEPFDDRHNSGVKAITAELLVRLADLDDSHRVERIQHFKRLVTAVLADVEQRLEHRQITGAQAAGAVDTLIRGATAYLRAI